MSKEWKGLPRPETIDPIARTWTITLEEHMALNEAMAGEENGRRRMDRYQQWICDQTGLPHWAALQIIVEPPHHNS